jgi:predicted dehydrogenase
LRVNPVSIGIIGAGLFGRKHIDAMRPGAMCKLAEIADPTPKVADSGLTLPTNSNKSQRSLGSVDS